MSQFSIYRVRGRDALVCRIQTDLGVPTPAILCAPVVALAIWGKPTPRLHLPVEVEGVAQVIVMTQMLAIAPSQLGPVVADAGDQRDAIVRALDLLVSGF